MDNAGGVNVFETALILELVIAVDFHATLIGGSLAII